MAVRDLDKEAEEQRQRRNALIQRESELDDIRSELAKREAMMEHRMRQEKKLLEQREREFFESVESRNNSLTQHEQAIAKRQEASERELMEQRLLLAEQREGIKSKIQAIAEMQQKLEQDKQLLTKDGQKALQDNSKKFVGSALSLLSAKESRFHWISGGWAVVGALSLVLGVVIAILTMINSSDSYHQAPGASLAYYFFHLFRGLVVVGLCGVLSRYAFIFSNSYMHESLKIGERAHAIRFGEFYLDTYGANAEWDQVKEAFAHWNISGQSAFSKSDPGNIDPSVAGAASKVVEKLVDAASNIGKKTGAS